MERSHLRATLTGTYTCRGLLPLDQAVDVALLSGDRFELGVGLGYRDLEFSGFGRNVKNRPSLLEDAIAIIRQAWTGSADGYEGKRLSLPALPVTPMPEVAPKLLVGAQSPVGIDRAARAGDGVITLSNGHCQVYLDALERHGRDVAEGRIYASQWTIIADDPERVWAQVSENVLYQMNKYIEWGSFEGPDQPGLYPNSKTVLDSGAYRLMDASMAVDELVTLATDFPQIRDFHYWAQFPGESTESGSERIQYMADKVIPAVTESLTPRAQHATAGSVRQRGMQCRVEMEERQTADAVGSCEQFVERQELIASVMAGVRVSRMC